ncbi:hypothetical protein CYY_007511 [Polysphondylium violaceum]|uniref:Glycosyltransferase n=1 Tax=Polysphondylium violaceum TaxID=133409 RepID=A0A8J4UQU6_9MYCE|nr:hypothetical protein CYY_007511 [Polysphondylium violaceum]
MRNTSLKSSPLSVMKMICIVFVIVCSLASFVCANEPSAIESSKVIQISMLSNWENTPLYLEAGEFLQEQDSTLFWNFIDEYIKHVNKDSNEKEQYDGIFKTLDIITSGYPEAKRALLKDMLSIRLSLRYYTAKVETMRQVVKSKLVDKDLLDTGIIQYNNKYLKDVSMVPLEMSITNLKPSEDQQTISMDSYEFDHIYPGNVNPVEMVDGVKKEVPVVVLYTNILSEHFKTSHNTLKYLARFGKIRYIIRYIVSDSTEKVHLQGYGFDLAIKNLEYKVMDDSAIKKDIKDGGESKTVVTIPDEDVKGFNFHKLQKRKPELTSKLSTFRSYLMAKSQESAELKVWEMKDLGVQTAQKISTSMDPLRSLKYINQNFPSIVQSLARTAVNESLRTIIESVQKTIPSTETTFLLNGLAVEIDSLNPIELSKILFKELECTSSIQGLGVSALSVQKMIAATADSIPLRFNLLPDKDEADIFVYLNNLETDYTYTSKWVKSIAALGASVGKPDDLFIAKNLMTTVLILDMADENSLALISELQNMIHTLVPTRFAIVLKTSRPADAPAEASDPADIAKIFLALRKSSLGNRGAMFFFSALSYFKRVYSPSGHVTINIIHSAFQAVLNQMGGNLRNLQQVLASTEYDEMFAKSNQYVSRLGLDSSLPQLFINGRVIATNTRSMGTTLPIALFDEFEQLKPLYKSGEISDTTQDYFSAILGSKHWAEIGNPLLTQFSVEIGQTGVQQVYKRLSSASNSLTKEKESSNIIKELVYFSHPESKGDQELLSVIVVGDFDQTKTQQIALQLLKKVAASPESKTRVALLPTAIDQLPSSHSIGKLLSITKKYKKQLVLSEVIRVLEAAISTGRKWSGIQSIIQDLSIKIERNDVWVSQSDNVFSLSSSIAKNYLDINVSLLEPVQLLLNGRVIEPQFEDVSAFVKESFAIQETIELLKAKSIQDILLQDSQVAKEQIPTLISNIRSLLGYYVDTGASRAKIPRSIPVSFTHAPANYENTPIRMTLLINPLSKVAQSLVPIVQKFSDKMNIAVDVILNPPTQVSDMPMKNYYSYVINLDSEFDKKTGEFISIPEGFITGLPESRVLTFAIDVPSSWLVQPIVAKYDLDNIRLKDLGEESVLEAVFELENIVIEGSCTDAYGQPPAGLELVLQPVATKSRVPQDTIVMSNVGYYQLKSNPGLWRLEIAQGRSSEIMSILDRATNKPIEYTEISVDSLYQGVRKLHVVRKPGQENKPILAPVGEVDKKKAAAAAAEAEKAKESDGFFSGLFGGGKKQDAVAKKEQKETIHIFSVASGHLYERFLKIMMLSVIKNTESPVKFWFLKNYLSPNFKEFIPKMAAEYGFEYELVTYKWPWWLRKQTEKQRIIWSYKILFLDVLFPLNIPKIIFVDADQVVRTDMKELWDMDLQGASLGYTPFCDSNTETEGFRFWKTGYWRDHLRGRPYHISALYVVDLMRFRKLSAGDHLRSTYDQLSRDANSLANLDQDLPNYLQHHVRIHSLPQEWLWCETWCDQKSKGKAKTIDLCNNPLTKTPKLENAVRIIDEWTSLDNEAKQLSEKFEPIIEKEQAEIIQQDEPKRIKNNEYIEDILGTINDAQKDLF